MPQIVRRCKNGIRTVQTGGHPREKEESISREGNQFGLGGEGSGRSKGTAGRGGNRRRQRGLVVDVAVGRWNLCRPVAGEEYHGDPDGRGVPDVRGVPTQTDRGDGADGDLWRRPAIRADAGGTGGAPSAGEGRSRLRGGLRRG